MVKTSPKTFFKDVRRVMESADFEKALTAPRTAIKLNLSWSKFFPSCSTNPYTYDAVVKTILDAGIPQKSLFSLENETVVTNVWKGIKANNWVPILKKYKQEFIPLSSSETPWEKFRLKRKTMVLERMFGPIEVPKAIIDANVLHLPTIKTHGHSMMTGALKNAFGLLLRKVRHQAHLVIHEILVDLLLIQQEVCSGLFTLTDGTIIGDGPGPRTMIPRTGNLLLASNDLVAADTIQCHIMGIDPRKVKKLVLAEQRRLGSATPENIEITGGDFSSIEQIPVIKTSPGMSPVVRGNRLVLESPLKPILHSRLIFFPTLASLVYHDLFWMPLIGRSIVKTFLKSDWGKFFTKYSED